MCELLWSGKTEIDCGLSVLFADWRPRLAFETVIGIRGVVAIGNKICIVLNGLMFGTIESGHIISTDCHSGMAAMRHCAVLMMTNAQ